MTEISTLKVDLEDVAKQITVRLELANVTKVKWRFWIGAKILNLAAAVLCCHVVVVIDDAE